MLHILARRHYRLNRRHSIHSDRILVISMRPINISEQVAQTTLSTNLPENTPASDITITITRVGDNSGWCVTYPALDYENGKLTFAWDNILQTAKSGRYMGKIEIKNKPSCLPCIPFNIDPKCTITQTANKEYTHKNC